MIIGTCYFKNKQGAINYYKEYSYTDVKKAVNEKLKRGEIHIGKPIIRNTEYLWLHPKEKRYFRIDKV